MKATTVPEKMRLFSLKIGINADYLGKVNIKIKE